MKIIKRLKITNLIVEGLNIFKDLQFELFEDSGPLEDAKLGGILFVLSCERQSRASI